MARGLAVITAGLIIPDKEHDPMNQIEELEGEVVAYYIEKLKTARRDKQNRYYRGVVIPCLVDAVIDRGVKLIGRGQKARNQVHFQMRMKYLMEEVEDNGKIIQMAGSTTDLSDEEFSDYIFLICELLREVYSYVVPEPKEKF